MVMNEQKRLDKNKILKSLTEDDIIKIVCGLGSLPPRKDNQGNLIFQTICHNPPDSENSWKLYYYLPDDKNKYGSFHCYSGCQDSFNIIELVIRANRANGKTLTWYKALYYIAKEVGKVITSNASEERDNILIDDFSWIKRLQAAKKNKKNVPLLSNINENILDIFYYAPHETWLNDHISREALSRYEIGYYGLTNQITIPHRDKEGRLIGIRGRFLDEEDVTKIGKYAPLIINGNFLNHSLGSNLYGLNVTQDKIQTIKKIMLVESEKGCLQNYSYFGDDSFAVAVCGSNITLTQQKIILFHLKCEEVIIAFDKEYSRADSFEAEAYYNKLVKKVADLVPYCKVCLLMDTEGLLEEKDSPTDKGKDVLLKLLDNKIIITMDEVNRVLQGDEKYRRTTKKD